MTTASRMPEHAGILSRAKQMTLPVGAALSAGEVRGYPIDMRVKAQVRWSDGAERGLGGDYVSVAQYGLGCYERWILGEGEVWLQAALRVGRFLLDRQHADGSWLNARPFTHTFPLRAPWRCAMAQGEAASLLVRLHLETGGEEYALGAQRALQPLAKPREAGGVQALIGGEAWPEEYPTNPASLVLNGAIFAWWGVHDVAIGLEDAEARAAFAGGVETLATNLHRFDTGHWSLYSLYPHPLPNVASSFYHALHIAQLQAMNTLAPHPQLTRVAERWTGYQRSAVLARRAFAQKVVFRLVVPRNRLLGSRLPWARYSN